MNCRYVRDRMDDYLDGRLSDSAKEKFERHLAACPECSDEVRGLRDVLSQAAALPKYVRPERDLWQGIEERIERVGMQRSAFWWPKGAGIAAAALVCLVAGYFMNSMHRDSGPSAVSSAMLEEVGKADAEYAREKNELMAMLAQSREKIDPATHRVIEENLAIIEGAIDEIRTALEEDPNNTRLMHKLAATQHQGLKLIALAVRLSQ